MSLNARDWMSNQMWLEQNAKYKNMILAKRNAKNKKKIKELNIEAVSEGVILPTPDRFPLVTVNVVFCSTYP